MRNFFTILLALVPMVAVADDLPQDEYVKMLGGISSAMADGPKVETYNFLRDACRKVHEVESSRKNNENYIQPVQVVECEKFATLTKM
ncbi:exported hypothetical protein [Agrobacterium fabacearum S56]|jgi:hypothetical protein|uniref:hypothetical protein n=1 Tax=Agrobacterium tumefaciens TaxID=358 RepID=UPI0009CC4419|nr:hypothetical protein [Agrobacterium tumefaciens]CUW90162.1 exported hypothetical protein [Agrobacterium fabacearum S56]